MYISRATHSISNFLVCRLHAAAQGDLAALHSAWQRAGRSWGQQGCSLSARAAAGGHLAVLQWLHQNGCSWDWRVCPTAARAGHLALLQWVRQKGCPWSSFTCTCAARGGHLAVLQWARQNGCDWSVYTCAAAAEGGHLPLLEWARQQGCPWDCKTTLAAAVNNHLAVLQWTRQQRPPCPWWSLETHGVHQLSAAKPSTLMCLAQRGAPLPAEAQMVACATATRLTHAYLALRRLLPDGVVRLIVALSLD